MRRVIILGGAGSGKSTLARALGARLGLPVVHLDQLYFKPGWQPRPEPEFAQLVAEAAAADAWVIDGNYSRTRGPRLARADTLIWLDLPLSVRLPRVIWRIARSHGRVREDMAPGCPERMDWAFLLWAAGWRNKLREKAMATIAAAPDTVTVRTLRSRADVRRFLAGLGAQSRVRPHGATPPRT